MKIIIAFLLIIATSSAFALNASPYTPPSICNYAYTYQDPYSKQTTNAMAWIQTPSRSSFGFYLYPTQPQNWQNGLCSASLTGCAWTVVSKNSGQNNGQQGNMLMCPSESVLYCDSTGYVAANGLEEGSIPNPRFPCTQGVSTFHFFSVKVQNS